MYRVTLLLISLFIITSCSIESQQCTKDDTLNLVSAGFTKEEISDICDVKAISDNNTIVNNRKNKRDLLEEYGADIPDREYGNSIHPNVPIPSESHIAFSQASAEEWFSLVEGESKNSFSFQSDAKVYYKGKEIASKLPVTYDSDGVVTYAKKVIISPVSKSERYVFIKGCDRVENGLCWATFLFDFESETFTKVYAGKYGPDPWVKWIKNDEYALLRYESHGENHLYRIDLASGESIRIK